MCYLLHAIQKKKKNINNVPHVQLYDSNEICDADEKFDNITIAVKNIKAS